MTPKRKNIIRYQKPYCKLSAISLGMITKKQIRVIYIEEISIKSDAKKIKYYHILKRLLLGFGQFSGHDRKATY